MLCMIALHALWDQRTAHLRLWAETTPGEAIKPRRGRKRADAPAQSHPFAAAGNALAECAGEVFGSVAVAEAAIEPIIVSLPSTDTSPLPSPELLCFPAVPPTRLSQWEVATMALPPDAALSALLDLPAQPPVSVNYGATLRFWSQVAGFAYELVLGQRFAPALQKAATDGALRAAWAAALSDDDTERLKALARAMPPACRAHDPVAQPAQLIQDCINTLIDAFVRASALSQRRSIVPVALATAIDGPAKLWLDGLLSKDGLIKTGAKTAEFVTQLREWLRQIRSEPNAPFRTCFRLEEPVVAEEGSQASMKDAWRVSFHLQANEDRSLLVPAEQVWRARGDALTFLRHKFENPQERLLADLGKAARVFPRIDESLRSARPIELQLATDQAYAFLRESAPLLEQSGFGVLLPHWWTKPAVKVGVKLKVKGGAQTSSGLMGMNAIVEYDWEVALGDQSMSLKEFEQLAQLKMPLVNVRGQWVELKPEEIEKAVAFFKKRHGGEMTLGEAVRLGLGHEKSETGMVINGVEAEGWVRDALERLKDSARIPNVTQPASFNGELRPYQLRGLAWLTFLRGLGMGACLADDMGLGKTPQTLAYLLAHRENITAKKTAPVLLICPMSIVGNWQREAQKFAPTLQVMVHHGAERLTGAGFAREAKRHDLVITTYALAQRDEERLSAVDWDTLILDEAQNIKNVETKQTQAIRRLKASHRIALTGTPVENRLSELWSIVDFLNTGYLGKAADFRSRFATPIEQYHDADRSDTLRRLTQPFILRRLKSDKSIITDLPDKQEMKVLCNLTREQATLYKAVVKEMLRKIEEAEGIERRGLVLATLLRLKQVCNHPAHYLGDGSPLPDRSGKLDRLEEMLEEALSVGDKALVFTQFSEMGGRLQTHLQQRFGQEVLFLYGGVPKKQRDVMVQRFQDEPHAAPIFVLSLKAGGVGLNLTAANHVFHFDRWWNPAVENQATDRAFRIGQRKNVQVHKFVCVGTLEERIDQMIEQKKQLAESIVGAGEAWLTELSTDQLRDLFTLGHEAVGD